MQRVSNRLVETRLLGRRGHSLSQHTQFLKNNMIDENVFYETLIQLIGPTRSHLACFVRKRFALLTHKKISKKKVCLNRLEML